MELHPIQYGGGFNGNRTTAVITDQKMVLKSHNVPFFIYCAKSDDFHID